jgi:hypothetical protein
MSVHSVVPVQNGRPILPVFFSLNILLAGPGSEEKGRTARAQKRTGTGRLYGIKDDILKVIWTIFLLSEKILY